ncbi:hypothetical protein [Vibrio parahaemolyticus]|uniref:hypothetical protein n=1 Tax=Vibrio parahaemolyticus TaxID=670 RepID=UPI001F4DEC9D|nr:hypothetical protein [Vibrio parahaemolyticus]
MKSLFTEQYSVTYEAADFISKYETALHRILNHYFDLGFNPFHVETIVRNDFVTMMRLVVFGEGKTPNGEIGIDKSFWEIEAVALPDVAMSLLNEDSGLHTEAGIDLQNLCRQDTFPIIDEILKKGYSPWEIQALFANSASDFFSCQFFRKLK